jgi:hypothetical protein
MIDNAIISPSNTQIKLFMKFPAGAAMPAFTAMAFIRHFFVSAENRIVKYVKYCKRDKYT